MTTTAANSFTQIESPPVYSDEITNTDGYELPARNFLLRTTLLELKTCRPFSFYDSSNRVDPISPIPFRSRIFRLYTLVLSVRPKNVRHYTPVHGIH